MASSRTAPLPPAVKSLDLEIVVVSAKHLKNVNWRHGDLKPYAVIYLDPDRRSATKPDDAGSTKPVWNERLTLPLPPSPLDDPSLVLTLDVFHSKPSETPKPLVGTARCSLKDLFDSDALTAPVPTGSTPIRTLELRRPSGRPQGQVRIRLELRERPAPPEPNYYSVPPASYYYSTAPPPQPPTGRDYTRYSSPPPPLPPYSSSIPPQPLQYPYGGYSDHYPGYYPSTAAYYSAPPAPTLVQSRPHYERASAYSGPSAPVDYSSRSSHYDQRAKGSGMGMGAGLAVGAVAGALGGLALEEGLKYEEEKTAERVESNLAQRDDYSDYHATY